MRAYWLVLVLMTGCALYEGSDPAPPAPDASVDPSVERCASAVQTYASATCDTQAASACQYAQTVLAGCTSDTRCKADALRLCHVMYSDSPDCRNALPKQCDL